MIPKRERFAFPLQISLAYCDDSVDIDDDDDDVDVDVGADGTLFSFSFFSHSIRLSSSLSPMSLSCGARG